MANQEYYSLITNAGINKIIKANTTNEVIKLTKMQVGDADYEPTADQTALKSKKHQLSLNSVIADVDNPNQFIIEGVISSEVGGFAIREVGVFAEDGSLFAIAKVPYTYKPTREQGAAKDLVIKITIAFDNSANLVIQVDNNIVLATRSHVANELKNLQNMVFLELDKKLNISTYEADKPTFVTTNTAQSISEIKTFTKLPQSEIVPTNPNELINKAYADSISKPTNIILPTLATALGVTALGTQFFCSSNSNQYILIDNTEITSKTTLQALIDNEKVVNVTPFGVGLKYQVTNKTAGIIYTNETGRSIVVQAWYGAGYLARTSISIKVDGQTVASGMIDGSSTCVTLYAIVPPRSTYRFSHLHGPIIIL
ncbi:phage tail-collar fiber protein (DUF3751 domain) [Campylobacter iguaniorum]|uniref:phage tail protein n=1 Tax=Campylobacter iguaniorum TaxID=1244531 RepID=UPI00073A0C92|nr:phage tail protein [Campylobacter iguaniorum]ALV24553.1 phage tail-collar fiber protein (DUF3751 domain) [Campylobacter iguaniorum]